MNTVPEVSAPVEQGRADTVSAVHEVTGPVESTEQPIGGTNDGELPEIRFVRHLPGFPGLSRYALVDLGQHGDDPVLYELRSLEQPEIRFMVAVPGAFFPDYEIELDAASCDELGLVDAADALVLVVLTVGPDLTSSTANLLAPVVVNARTRAAAQVILSGSDWPVRAAVG
jgi:flagellar assembly factor FliW